jgi:hypothetical protein
VATNKKAVASSSNDGVSRVLHTPMPITVMVHGLPKVGKTRFAGTFPRPLFAFVQGEHGTHSLPDLERDDIFQYAIGAEEDLEILLGKLPELIKKYDLRSLVIDTGSLLGSLFAVQAGNYGRSKVEYQGWARIKGAFLNTRDRVAGLGLHLVWVMHTVENKDEARVVFYEPLLVGKALNDIIPSCNIVCYLTKDVVPSDPNNPDAPDETIRNLWVRCPSNASPRFLAGTHFDNLLTAPSYEPDWAVLAKYLKGRVLDA